MRRPSVPLAPSSRRGRGGHARKAPRRSGGRAVRTVQTKRGATLPAAFRRLILPAILSTVLLGSIVPAARAEDPLRADDWRISRAMRVAERIWGGLPAETNVVTVRRDEANSICEHDPGYEPIACAESPDLATIPGRRIWWNLDATAMWPDGNPAYVCAVAVHEVGHLLGLGHVDDPKSIMYRGDPLPVPDDCKPTVRHGTHRHRTCAARSRRHRKCRARRHLHRQVDWSLR